MFHCRKRTKPDSTTGLSGAKSKLGESNVPQSGGKNGEAGGNKKSKEQRPTCRILQQKFKKKVVTVATPGRMHNMNLMNICGGNANAASFSTQMLESNVMTASVITPNGFARRPAEYDKK